MITKINKTDLIKTKLRDEGKVTCLDQAQHFEAIVAMNDNLENVRQEYYVKDRNSQTTAAYVILTA